MGSLQTERVIRAELEVVFDALTDVASWPDRIEGIQAVELLDEGPVRDGTRFRETRVMFRKEATEEMTFRDVDRPRGYGLESHSCGAFFRFDYDITPTDDGGTPASRVVLRGTWGAETFGAKVMNALLGWMMTGQMCKAIEKDFDDLKRSLEA